MSQRPLIVDWRGLKKMGWPFCRAQTDRGEKDGRYPRSYKLGVDRNSRRVWLVAAVLAYFEAHGIPVTQDWHSS
jgi:hypothetical protein